MKEASKVILSGEHSRRRGYLTNVIVSLNALAVMGSLSIWGFFIRWDFLYGETQNQELFAIQLACASGLSSILLGLWRLYVRYLDGAIIRLYPVLYLCELKLIPREACSIKPPKSATAVTDCDNIDWKFFKQKEFDGRGHGVIDCIACFLIIAFGFITVIVAKSLNVIEFRLFGSLHTVTYLLSGNVIGLLLVLIGWLLWRYEKVKWPIPKTDERGQREPEAQPIVSANGGEAPLPET